MPRQPVSPAARIAKLKADAPLATNAVAALLRAIDKGDAEGAQDAAKFLEAFGCYARRTDVVPAPAPRAIRAQQRVVIVGPNLNDQSKGTFHVHAEGCADLKRDPNMRGEDQSMVVTAATRVDVADYIYGEDAGDFDGTPESNLPDFHFAPCVNLPVK